MEKTSSRVRRVDLPKRAKIVTKRDVRRRNREFRRRQKKRQRANIRAATAHLWWVPLLVAAGVALAWFLAFNVAQGVVERDELAVEVALDAQVKACERANLIREELNAQADLLELITLDVISLLSETQDAPHEELWLLLESLDRIEILDCPAIIPTLNGVVDSGK